RGALGVRNLHGGRHNRRRAGLTFGVHRLRSFDDAPTEVVPLVDAIDELPQLPANVADPQIARPAVEAHLPRVAQAVSPGFAAGLVELHERVVGGDRVGPTVLRAAHVDPQD